MISHTQYFKPITWKVPNFNNSLREHFLYLRGSQKFKQFYFRIIYVKSIQSRIHSLILHDSIIPSKHDCLFASSSHWQSASHNSIFFNNVLRIHNWLLLRVGLTLNEWLWYWKMDSSEIYHWVELWQVKYV